MTAMAQLDLCDYKQIRGLLAAADFHFSKAKGQNFLIASWVPERIAAESGVGSGDGVVEIGPGVGCLTERLAERAERVLAYETDEALRPVLARTMAGRENVDIIFEDVLRRDLAADAEEHLAGLRPVVCANLPYSITSPVLTKLYQARCFRTITVMVQKEMALRMCSGPGGKDYSAFSLLTEWYGTGEILFDVGPECFVPRPKVTSAVVRLKMREAPPLDVNEKALFRVIRAAFNQRRKTLANALDGLCGRETAARAIAACGLDERVRGEALDLAAFAALTTEIGKLSDT